MGPTSGRSSSLEPGSTSSDPIRCGPVLQARLQNAEASFRVLSHNKFLTSPPLANQTEYQQPGSAKFIGIEFYSCANTPNHEWRKFPERRAHIILLSLAQLGGILQLFLFLG